MLVRIVAATVIATFSCCREPQPASERASWVAMGTVAAVQTRGADVRQAAAIMETAKGVFARVEHEFSRFDPDSVLRKTGGVSEFGRPCLVAAQLLKTASHGAFDCEWRGKGDLDFGGIAKGFAVDLAAKAVAESAADVDVLVDLGGNLKAVRGTWDVGVRDPGDASAVAARVSLAPGESLSTSAEYFRGSHIVDGRTGRPATNGVASVTVLCESATLADGLSTALFVLGPEDGVRFLREWSRTTGRCAALWVMKDGSKSCFDDDRRFSCKLNRKPHRRRYAHGRRAPAGGGGAKVVYVAPIVRIDNVMT